MRSLIRSLFLGAVLALAGHAAFAQTDTSYFVGAIPKTAVAALGGGLTVTTVAASGTTQTVTAGTYGSSAYDITLTANCTFTVTGFVSGVRGTIHLLLRQDGTGSRTFTLPTVKWQNGATPTFTTTAGTVYDLKLTSTDGGTTLIAQ